MKIRDLKIEGNIAEGFFAGDINRFLKDLSGLRLKDIILDDPNLEEIFMHYYDDSSNEDIRIKDAKDKTHNNGGLK